MPQIRRPRRGSLQIWPRVRAKRIYPKIRSHLKLYPNSISSFIGYKAGMTHITFQDNFPASPTKGETVTWPITILECPPLKTYSLRFYKKTPDGLALISEIFNKKITKDLLRKIKPSKKENSIPETYDEIRLLAYSQPSLTGIGKKKPEMFETLIPGEDNEEKINFAKSLFDKDIKISDFFKEGDILDVHAVTKGKGFQGTVKRYGVKILQHKSEKKKRGIGTLGSWHPAKVQFSVAQPGKMGYHTRTEYNKTLLKISDKPNEINPKGGFVNYGLIKSLYILIKGSIPGPQKRPIIISKAIRPTKKQAKLPEIQYISLTSKQSK